MISYKVEDGWKCLLLSFFTRREMGSSVPNGAQVGPEVKPNTDGEEQPQPFFHALHPSLKSYYTNYKYFDTWTKEFSSLHMKRADIKLFQQHCKRVQSSALAVGIFTEQNLRTGTNPQDLLIFSAAWLISLRLCGSKGYMKTNTKLQLKMPPKLVLKE